MAHRVRFTVPETDLGPVDIAFRILRNGELLGRLLVSKGNIEWKPSNKRPFKLYWGDFDQVMQIEGRKRRRPMEPTPETPSRRRPRSQARSRRTRARRKR